MSFASPPSPGEYRPEDAALQVDAGIWLLDLGFQDRAGVVAAYLLHDDHDVCLIECGPSSTIDRLEHAAARAGFALGDIGSLLVTHIHLDHAGAAGTLARRNPALKVYVHPFGAPHLIDPAKLLASATRIYGERMEPLWGEVAPVPADQVVALGDGQAIPVAGRSIEAIFTPGHAWHHIAYWDAESGAAFTGDVGGVRMPGTGYACPPTPPPDLDQAAWIESTRRLAELHARRWYLTHFGPFDDADSHLASLMPNLSDLLRIGEQAIDGGATESELTELIHGEMARRLGDVHPSVLTNLEWATPSYMAALGLARWHRKRTAAAN